MLTGVTASSCTISGHLLKHSKVSPWICSSLRKRTNALIICYPFLLLLVEASVGAWPRPLSTGWCTCGPVLCCLKTAHSHYLLQKIAFGQVGTLSVWRLCTPHLPQRPVTDKGCKVALGLKMGSPFVAICVLKPRPCLTFFALFCLYFPSPQHTPSKNHFSKNPSLRLCFLRILRQCHGHQQ